MDRPTLVTQLLLIQHVLFNTQMALLSLSLSLSLIVCVWVYETKKERVLSVGVLAVCMQCMWDEDTQRN